MRPLEEDDSRIFQGGGLSLPLGKFMGGGSEHMNPLGGLPEMHRGAVAAPGDGLVGGPRGGGHGVPALRELPGYQ